MVALLLLPLMIKGVALLADGLELEGSPAAFLALFHTVFNLLGVLIMLPLTRPLTRFLEHRFTSQEELAGRPRHLDTTLTATPALAVAALRAELLRLRDLTLQIVHDTLQNPEITVKSLEQQTGAIHTLVSAVADYVGTVRTATMSFHVGDSLARSLRIARYLDEAARLSCTALMLRQEMYRDKHQEPRTSLKQLFEQIQHCCLLVSQEEPVDGEADEKRLEALDRFEELYQQAKADLLNAAVARSLTIDRVDRLLGHLSSTRRMVEQLVKADRLLRSPARGEEIEAERRHEQHD